MTIEEFDKTMENIPKIQTNNPISSMNSINVDELRKTAEIFKRIPTFDDLQKENNKLLKEKQELIEFLKEEQDRLARECSPIYEDSLGRTRLVSEDIYNEVSKILSKIEKSDK